MCAYVNVALIKVHLSVFGVAPPSLRKSFSQFECYKAKNQRLSFCFPIKTQHILVQVEGNVLQKRKRSFH